MKNKIKSYGFWTALAGAVVVLVNALGQMFGFSVDNEIITNVIMAIAGLLVVLGVVTMPKGEDGNQQGESEETDAESKEIDAESEEIDAESESETLFLAEDEKDLSAEKDQETKPNE